MRVIRREDLVEFLDVVAGSVGRGSTMYLVGATSQLFEGWVPGVRWLTVAEGEGTRGLSAVLERAAERAELAVLQESPADVVPLPPRAAERARPVAPSALAYDSLELRHFDPYSVSLRLLARGDEDDYQVVLAYLRHGWMEIDTMDDLVAAVLPQFTRDVIEQDPAEFRRKYRGLCQMWRAERT